jgi:hypothetical protein
MFDPQVPCAALMSIFAGGPHYVLHAASRNMTWTVGCLQNVERHPATLSLPAPATTRCCRVLLCLVMCAQGQAGVQLFNERLGSVSPCRTLFDCQPPNSSAVCGLQLALLLRVPACVPASRARVCVCVFLEARVADRHVCLCCRPWLSRVSWWQAGYGRCHSCVVLELLVGFFEGSSRRGVVCTSAWLGGVALWGVGAETLVCPQE